MKFKYIFIASVTLLNIYTFIVWLWVFNNYSNQQDKVQAFLDVFYVFKSINSLDFTLASLTLISLALAIQKFKYKIIIISIFIHMLFLLLLIWSRL